MAFAAKYPGHCAGDCRYGDSEIRVGDEVDFVDDTLMHGSCASRARRSTLPPLCPDCYTHHNGECL